MTEKALYILAGYDDKTEETLSGIQNRLYEHQFNSVQTKGIPMHFTMGSYGTEREEELKERLARTAEAYKAFYVAFNHAGLFRLPENDVLFIAPETNRAMLALKDCFADNRDTFSWSPHTTMLINKPDVILKAVPVVMDAFSPFGGKVASLHLYEFWPTRHVFSVRLTD